MAKQSPEHWQSRIVGYADVDPNELLANPANWRVHPKAQQDALSGVLSEVGWVQAVVVNKTTGHVVDGHLRVSLALSRDEATIPVVLVELTEDEEKLILATIDPIAAMAVADKEQLDELLKGVNSDSAAVQELIAGIAEANGLDYGKVPPGDPGAAMDRAEELQVKWGTARGQIWQVGRHRVMCGDAYSEDDRSALLGGQEPDILHIDPPYGISIVQPRGGASRATDGGPKPFGGTSGTERRSGIAERNPSSAERGHVQHGAPSRNQIIQSNLYPVIEGDDRSFDPSAFIDISPKTIMWGANYFADKLPPSPCWIVWDKREDITRNTFADCEIAWTNIDAPARLFHHLWNGLHKGSQHGERRTHPTEKPVALFAEIGKKFCDGGLWLDLFAGTGAQIVAAEQSGAICYANEIEPLYVAVTLERLSGMGLVPELVKSE